MSTNGSAGGGSTQGGDSYGQVTRFEDGTDKGSNANPRNIYTNLTEFWANDVAIHLGLCGNMRLVKTDQGRVTYEAVLRLKYPERGNLEDATEAWALKIANFEPFVEKGVKLGKIRYLSTSQVIPFTVFLSPWDVEQYFVRLVEVLKFKKRAEDVAAERARARD